MTAPDRPSVTDNARADHTITYRHDRDTVTAVIRCHAAADADCRLRCDHPDGYCDEWHIERDKGGPFHTVEAEDDTTGEYREERHPLVPASSCNAVEWIGNWDVHEAGPYETFDIATIPIEPVWNGDGYTWKRVTGRAETATATTEDAPRWRVVGTWLAEDANQCTCGGGGQPGHEQMCGLEPIVDLATLPGWIEASTTRTRTNIDGAYRVAYDTMRHHPGIWYNSLRAAVEALATAGLLARPTPSRDQIAKVLFGSRATHGAAPTAPEIYRLCDEAADAVLALLEGGGDE